MRTIIMRQKGFLHSLLIILLLCISSFQTCKAKEENIHESDPIVMVQNRYKKLFMDRGRYKPPFSLSNKNEKFRRLDDLEKERRLLRWFNKKVRKNIIKITLKEIRYKIFFMLLVVPVFLLVFGASYWAVMQIFLRLLGTMLKILSSASSLKDLKPLAEELSNAAFKLKTIPRLLGNNNPNKVEVALQSQALKANNMVTILALYYTVKYFKLPFLWIWKHVYNTWCLYKFMQEPYLEGGAVRADQAYIRSYYLFDDEQKRIMENLLISAHLGIFTRSQELEEYVLTYRSMPKFAKPMVYDQKAIDLAFEGYDPAIKELAENVIALLVIYTEAIEAGKGRSMQGLPIKPILLSGLPGTGKSRFIKKISEVTGLNITYINLATEFSVEFKGQNGDQQLLGRPSAYVSAFRASADQFGRNYENNLVVFEEISSNFDHKMAVDYLKIFLDPRVKKVKDAYMRTPIPKLPFIFATSNKLPENAALYDRFMIFELNSIAKNNKKMIMGKQVRVWSSLLSDPELQDEYEEDFSDQEVITHLTEKAHNFIDQKDTEGSIRPSEEETLKEVMSLIKAKIKKKSERKNHAQMEVLQAA